MSTLPDGIVTFLFTDIEGSTRLWEEASAQMMDALRLLDDVIETASREFGGLPVKPRGEGDSHFIVFRSAVDAVAGAVAIQRRLAEIDWSTPRPIRVRTSIHTGEAQLELGDYYGSAVNRAARLRAIAHGGQTVISGTTFRLVENELPAGVTLADMGTHRLKDLTRPEHVFQVDVEGLETSFPPLKSLDSVANNLPEQMTELIGRGAELTEIKRMLAVSRLVTVLAPGGTGKTRLAIQAGADLGGDFSDGVFFIALADISTSGDILQTAAEAVGVALSSGEDPLAQLLAYLKPRRQLLIFDNFEHVSDGALIVSDILRSAPDISVIATSRSRLNLTGESILPLTGLKTAWTTPEEAHQTSSVRLFLDAAHRVRPDLTPTSEDLDAIAEIVRLTDGLPLGILLAAAWVDMLSIPEIAREITQSLDFLETDAADAPDRHRSIRAVFDYTWGLLDPDERRAFASLSVFRGGFTRDAASSIAGASLRDLANLAGKSLISADPDSGRYSVHELLRQYAQEELENLPDRHEDIIRRHADYFGVLAREAFEAFARGEQRSALRALEGDIDNLRPAFRHHVAGGNGGGICTMVGGLYILHEVHGWYQAALALFGEAAAGFDGKDAEAVVAGGYLGALHGLFLALLGRPAAGVETADPVVDVMRGSGDTEAMFFALLAQATAHLYVRDFADCSRAIDEIEALEAEGGSSWPDLRYWVAGLRPLGAFAALATGDRERAERLLDESSAVLEQVGDSLFMTWNLGHRGRLAVGDGRLEEAIRLFTQSVDLARSIGFLRGMQVSLAALGDANRAFGNLRESETAYLASLDAADRTGMVAETLGVLVRISMVLSETGRQDQAVSVLASVLSEPSSAKQVFTDTTPIATAAAAQLEKLQAVLDDETFERSRTEGSARPLGALVKELTSPVGSQRR